MAFLMSLLILTGCADSRGAKVQESGEHTALMKSTGRYLEESMELPQELASREKPESYLQKLDNGNLMLVDAYEGMYVSSDNGQTWESQEAPWLSDIRGQGLIYQISISPSGTLAVTWKEYMKERVSSVEQLEEFANFGCIYVKDGKEIKLAFPELESGIYSYWLGKDDRLFGYGLNRKIYEIDPESGTLKELFEAEKSLDYIGFTGQYMIAFLSGGVEIYNLNTGSLEKDEVLDAFVRENVYRKVDYSGSDGYPLLAEEGEQEDVLYLACEKGLYRHVIGGAVMEQVVDGNITSFGDTALNPRGMAVLSENEFVVLYNQPVGLCSYIYDETAPTVPEEQIRIYSLQEEEVIRQAVSLYRKQNPDIYVRYEVGMADAGALTEEDAIKKLNTKMLAGEGPDILVLDGLPERSYEEKGVLADLGSYADSMGEEERLLPNLEEAFRSEGHLYSLPVRFRIPLLVGDPESIERITDIGTLADTVERLREEQPEGMILNLLTEEEVLYTLGLTSMSAWVDESGTIDKPVLTEFLTQAKRIYQTELAGLDREYLEEERVDHERHRRQETVSEERHYAQIAGRAMYISVGSGKLGVGTISGLNSDFNIVSTFSKKNPDMEYKMYPGQEPGGFIPVCRVGIYVQSAEKECVWELFRMLFQDEMQDMELLSGLPVSQRAFDRLRNSPDLYAPMVMWTTEDGGVYSLDFRWADEEQFGRLQEMVQSLRTPCIVDRAIEQAVYEIGPKALNGSASVEETVEEITKKAALYLAE